MSSEPKPTWTPVLTGKLEHGMNCPDYPGNDEDCTCGLRWRIALQTEQTMSAAWRKRAEEAEAKLTPVNAKGKSPGEVNCVAYCGKSGELLNEVFGEVPYANSECAPFWEAAASAVLAAFGQTNPRLWKALEAWRAAYTQEFLADSVMGNLAAAFDAARKDRGC